MTDDEGRELLQAVLDTLVPAGDGFPAAGAVALDHVCAMADTDADFAAAVRTVLSAVEDAADAATFAALDADAREALLRGVETRHPEDFGALVRQTYFGYYGHSTVVAWLGLEPGPVHPRGHQLEVLEIPDLAHIIARGPVYRAV